MNLKNKLIEFILNIYSWFFKTKPTKEVRIFVESLLFVFVATGIAKGLLFIINIWGGRLLGPSLYGEYTLMVSVSSFLSLPIGFAVVGGLVKSLAEVQDEKKRKKIISTATNYFGLTLILFTTIYLLFYRELSALIKIGPSLFLLAIVLTVFWTSNAFMEALLKALHKQKTWSYLTSIAYVVAFGAFIALISMNKINLLLIYVPVIIIYGVFTLLTSSILRKYFSLKIIDKYYFKTMFKFGFYVYLISIATKFLGNVDKVMLNYFLGAESVGTYQAYFLSSIMIIGVLVGVFITVFSPTAIKLKNPKNMMRKLDRIMFFAAGALIIVIPIIQYLILSLYNYTFNFSRSLLFMITTIADVAVVLYAALLNAQSIDSIRRSSIGVIIVFLLNIPLNFFLIQSIGLNGAIIATAISNILLFLYMRHNLKIISNQQNDAIQ